MLTRYYVIALVPIVLFLCFTACVNGNSNKLLQAIDTGDLARVKSLIQQDPSLIKRHYVKIDGFDALMISIGRGQKDIVEYLIESGADVNGVYSVKLPGYDIEVMCTPLTKASSIFRTDIAKLLLNSGADVQWKDKSGDSVIIWAVRSLKVYTFDNQVTKGDPVEFYKLLLDNAANPNDTNQDGDTPLHFLVKNTNDYPKVVDIVDLFLAKGADPFKKNNAGVSPYEQAKREVDPSNESTIKEIMAHMERYKR